MYPTIVGSVRLCEKVNGKCSEERAIAVRLTWVTSKVAYVKDAVEGLFRDDADMHQVALTLG